MFNVLVFSKTAGFRHSSIEAGVAAIQELGAAHNFAVTASEDASLFTDAGLAPFAVIIFLNTTGDILNAAQQGTMERFIQNGGGFVGIHSATDTEYDWAWYGQLVGSYFDGHPAIQPAEINVVTTDHLATLGLPNPWLRTDEWYNFAPTPSGVTVLLTVDESTYSGGTMGNPHPIAWYHEFDGGRSFYTGLGHTEASYSEPHFHQHLLGGIWYAAGINVSPVSYLPFVQK
ncbi:MAG: ThuA domain-containing protein [Anaerolineaceae bacterium]|nr:ThuA domain-containing protein [Anaerolineaceae bacterium]